MESFEETTKKRRNLLDEFESIGKYRNNNNLGWRTLQTTDIPNILKAYNYKLDDICKDFFIYCDSIKPHMLYSVNIGYGRYLELSFYEPEDMKKATAFDWEKDGETDLVLFHQQNSKYVSIKVSNVHPETSNDEILMLFDNYVDVKRAVPRRNRVKGFNFLNSDVYITSETLYKHIPRKIFFKKRKLNVFYRGQPAPIREENEDETTTTCNENVDASESSESNQPPPNSTKSMAGENEDVDMKVLNKRSNENEEEITESKKRASSFTIEEHQLDKTKKELGAIKDSILKNENGRKVDNPISGPV